MRWLLSPWCFCAQTRPAGPLPWPLPGSPPGQVQKCLGWAQRKCTCSDYALTLLHSFTRPHCVQPPVLWFTVSLTATCPDPLCPELTAGQTHLQRAGGRQRRKVSSTQVWGKPVTDITIDWVGFIADGTGCGEGSRVKTNICWTPTKHQALLHARWHWTDWS